ncbi:hypothetical protein GDO78_008539 [Eleutherodactylus coqui]|nr:hypothetical protein GDO78_008539 [Eleutherodactylus coqui]
MVATVCEVIAATGCLLLRLRCCEAMVATVCEVIAAAGCLLLRHCGALSVPLLPVVSCDRNLRDSSHASRRPRLYRP